MSDFIRIGDYFDGYAKVKFSDGKFGFVHLDGKILPDKFAEVESFKNGVAMVKLDSGRWVNINTKGEFVRSNYSYQDLEVERERQNNKLRLKNIIENTIDEMGAYIENMFDSIEKMKVKNANKRGN
jgi:hypothetical protein